MVKRVKIRFLNYVNVGSIVTIKKKTLKYFDKIPNLLSYLFVFTCSFNLPFFVFTNPCSPLFH